MVFCKLQRSGMNHLVGFSMAHSHQPSNLQPHGTFVVFDVSDSDSPLVAATNRPRVGWMLISVVVFSKKKLKGLIVLALFLEAKRKEIITRPLKTRDSHF